MSRFHPRALALIALVLSSSELRADQKLVVPVVMNTIPRGEIIAVLRDADVLVPSESLPAWGVSELSGARETIAGVEYVSLASLAPLVRFRLDERTLALELTADPSLLGRRIIDLDDARPPDLEYAQNASGFFNYSLGYGQGSELTGSGEVGVWRRQRLFYSSFTRGEAGDLVRGSTHLTWERVARLQRITVGDGVAFTDELGGGLAIGGVSISRDFGLDPYFIRYPGQSFAGAVETPSTIEVYVNDVLVRRTEIAPGEFELDSLAVPIGSGSTRIVLRDTFGRERVITDSYYASSSILAKGFRDYRADVGLRRENTLTDSFDYGEAVALGSYRYGLTEQLTVGVRAEASETIWNAGGSTTLLLPIGEGHLGAALSGDGSDRGWAGVGRYSYLARSFSLAASLRAFSDEYANLSLRAEQPRNVVESVLTASTRIAGLDVQIQLQHAEQRSGEDRSRYALSTNLPVGRRANLYVSAGQTRHADDTSVEISGGLTIRLGDWTSAHLRAEKSGDSVTTSAGVQRPLPVGEGYGYRVETRQGDFESSQASLLYQTGFGRYEIGAGDSDGGSSWSGSASGGVAFIGGKVYPTRAVDASFALVRVPGVEGVGVYNSNQKVGETDAQGHLLVPNLIPYYGNRMSIEPKDIPIAYEIDDAERVIAPPSRGGAVVDFEVRSIRTVTGRIEETGGESLAYGDLVLLRGEKRFASPIGAGGEFYFENLPAGEFAAQVRAGETRCTARLVVPDIAEPFIVLPTVRCQAAEGAR